ncbi:MAG: ribose-5-phosphate isomerase RpiA [Capsulimonadaceae bacterium]
MEPKQAAAERAVEFVADGMNVGLGTGRTAAYAIAALGRRIAAEGITIRAIATSAGSHTLARDVGIPLVDWDDVRRFDITIDGADEVDPAFRLIKGGGGALVREKIVAAATDVEIIIVDPGKMVPALGAFPLPVAVLDFGWQATRDRLESLFGCRAVPRQDACGGVFLSDDGLIILDMHFGRPLPDPDNLEARLKSVVGVVEVGLFVGLCHRVLVGRTDGGVDELGLGGEWPLSTK